MAVEDEQLLYTDSVFEYQNRPKRDVGWAVLYFVFLAATAVLGIYGILNANGDFKHAFNDKYMSNPGNCPLKGSDLLELGAQEEAFNFPDFLKHAALWLVVSSASSLLLGLVFILVFKHFPHAMTKATIAVQIAVPAVMGIFCLLMPSKSAGQGGFISGIVLLGLAALSAFTFYLWRREVELCARLLGVAAVGLNSNPGVLVFVLLSKVVLSLLIIAKFVLVVFAYANGEIVYNEARQGAQRCVTPAGDQVPCCVWQPHGWLRFYLGLVAVTTLWTIFLIGQLRVYVLSGTIAQWYFAPSNSANATRGTTLRSIKHALGPSFGTLSFGAAILTAGQLIRDAVESARQDSNNGEGAALFWSLISCFVECVCGLLEYLTKFATVMAAITGEAFMVAGRKSTELLQRNFLKSYSVWWFPPMVLHLAAFSLSAVWGVFTYLLYWLFSKSFRYNAKLEAGCLGLVSFLVAWIVLSFFSSILLNIVDAVYLCYAIDKDNQTVTKAEIHDIYSEVPVGVAVEQPAGEVQYGAPSNAYGAPPDPYARRAYVPPSHPAAAQNFRDSAARV